MKIIFFGADPWMSVPVLEALIGAKHEILLTVTKNSLQNLIRSDLPSIPGSFKGRTLQANMAEDITKRKLQNLIRSDLVRRGRTFSEPDVIVLAAFGPPFLGNEVLNWPKYGCLNVHASLLPRWRGASPVFAAIKNGDKETGVTIMKMTKEVDRGPILEQKKIKIRQPNASLDPSSRTPRDDGNHNFDNRESLTKKLGILGGRLIVETLKKLKKGQIKFISQPKKSPTVYTRRLTKEDGEINWSKSPAEIEKLIRAVTPWPGATASLKFKITNSKWQNIENIKILKAHIGSGKLVVDTVQLAGKNPISWKQFMVGHTNAELI